MFPTVRINSFHLSSTIKTRNLLLKSGMNDEGSDGS